jgi:hypothetical protein
LFSFKSFKLFVLGVAVSAIDRLVAARLEGNLGFRAASSTGYRVHLARASRTVVSSTISLRLSLLAAGGTAFGIVGQTLGSIKLLLFNSEGKGSATIRAYNRFFCETHRMTSIQYNIFLV